MSETPALRLPLILAEQAQKHVTHNEALRALDALVQLSVIDRNRIAPPVLPANGDRHIVAAGAAEAWAGHDGEIAAWQDGAWAFYAAREGWRCWVEDEDLLLVFDGSDWAIFGGPPGELQNLALLGLGTTADATNPFSAKLNKALWAARTVAEGGDGDLRYTMSKESAADVLSLLLQSGFSGRAEIGLIGDDDLTIKVSPDGSNWVEAMRIDKDEGTVTFDPASALLVVDAANDRVLLGTATAKTNVANPAGGASTPAFQRYGTNATGGSMAQIVDNPSAGNYPLFYFAKGSAAGAACGAADNLGSIAFSGSDGSLYLQGAAIRGQVDGVAPTTNNLVGCLAFFTNSGSAAITERLRIDRAGQLIHRNNATTIVDAESHLGLRSYTVATVPSAANAGRLIHVSNGMGNKNIAVSDGSAWRFADGTIVS